MKNFKKDLIIHWIIYNVSILVFLFTALWLSSLKVVPVWVLGGSLIIASTVLFGFHVYWFWRRWLWSPKTKSGDVND